MLTAIVGLSLRYKLLVIVVFAIVVFLGVRAFQQVPVDAFPDVTPVQVNVYTESPGLAAEDVETLLTVPIETAMAGLPGVEQVRSVSLFGLSYVSVYFTDSTDIYFARRLVDEKLAEAKTRIPAGYGEPELGPNSTGLGQVLWYTIESADRKLSNMDLRTLQDWTVRLLLRTAPGVDDVTSWGGLEKQYQVQIDPQRLIKYGLNFREVMEALDANNRQVGGQYIDRGKEQFLVRGLGRVSSVDDIANIVIATRENTPIRVRDVADVKEGSALRFGAVTRDGKEVVLGIALQRIGENAAKVAQAVKAKLELARKALPPGVTLNAVYDRTELVDKAVGTAERALIEGSAPTLAQPHGFGPSGMGEMGGQMGEHGGGQQQLYPSLMTAPPAGPAALREAHRRMTSGLPLLREGLDEARRALQAGDAQAMREAADRLSEGLNLYRSGLSTHLALSAGHTPAQAALGWYRGQLGLPVATVMPMATDGGGVL